MLPWSSFFDDFITFASARQTRSAEYAVTSMFKLLGWAFAESGDKSLDFAECFQALGIVIDLSRVRDGLVFFKNTERRVAEIKAFVGKVLDDGRLPHHEALRLRGRCQFADSQIFGRVGKKCLSLITAHAFGLGESIGLELRVALERFLLRLEVEATRDKDSRRWCLAGVHRRIVRARRGRKFLWYRRCAAGSQGGPSKILLAGFE